MAKGDSLSLRHRRWMTRMHARAVSWARPATGFVSQPEPRSIGSLARGRQLISGNFLFAGYLVEAPDTPIWDLPAPDSNFESVIHGCTWLDDLAAVGTRAAGDRAQDWVHGWVLRYGRGHGPGWSPDLTGRRLIRWINHAVMLLNGQPPEVSRAFFRSLGRQTIFLSRRWRVAPPGLARFEALTGLIYAGHALTGMGRHAEPALRALTRECAHQIDAQGGLPTRNPEELLEVFVLLNWAIQSLDAVLRPVPKDLAEAVARIAPTLRALRHADGGLARFHGGGRGAEGALDAALAHAAIRRTPDPSELHMGFARLSHGRTSIIMDAAAPPGTEASADGHASTLAFELTSGRRPVIVTCGSGRTFGQAWRRAGRATPSHSTLGLEGYSSARLGVGALSSGRQAELLVDSPRDVRAQRRQTDFGSVIIAGQDGYSGTHGLTHIRQLELSRTGRELRGQDTLSTLDRDDEARFDAALDRTRLRGVSFNLRFHLHPEVEPQLDMGGAAVSLALKSGEIWIFRHDGTMHMALEPSVYLDSTRLAPRTTKQIVLSARATEYATRVVWALAKAQDMPRAIRDLEREDALAHE